MPKLRGLGTTRKGRPIIGLQTLIDRSHRQVKRASEDVDLNDAEQAINVLQRSKNRGARLRDYTLAGSLGKPVVSIMGSMTEHGIKGLQGSTKGQRLAGLGKGLAHGFTNAATLAKVPRQAVEGGVGGGLLAGAREGLEAKRARRVAHKFIGEEKTAEQKMLSDGLRKSVEVFMAKLAKLPSITKKIQPVPTSKLQPIVDSEYDFEV